MNKKYVVCDWTFNGDLDTYVFDAAEQANYWAENIWNHLTAREKKKRRIYAAVVQEDWCDPDELEEYGDRAYGMASDMDSFPGAFDSEEEEKENG